LTPRLPEIPAGRLHFAVVQLHPKLLPRHIEERIADEACRGLIGCEGVVGRNRVLRAAVSDSDMVNGGVIRLEPLTQFLSRRRFLFTSANVVSMLSVDLAVRGQPIAACSDENAIVRTTHRAHRAVSDLRHAQRGIGISGKQDDAIRARSGERRQRVNLRGVRSQDAVQGRQCGSFGGRELEGVAVEDEIDGAAMLRIDHAQELSELRRPAKVLVAAPLSCGIAPGAHVQIADDDDGSLSGRLSGAGRCQAVNREQHRAGSGQASAESTQRHLTLRPRARN